MTFDEILAQILELLQREKRVSYRALKRRFDLDDDYLEDIKDEIIKAKRLATDEEGSVLVWTGDTQTGSAQSDQRLHQPAAQQQPSLQVTPLPTVPPPDAERRQHTVMFCDLVDTTQLSSQLDPEEYRNVVRAYQSACTEVIQRYDGHIATRLGDGILVYFGYPQAHEDDAQRAVRDGLGIRGAIGDLNSRLQKVKGIQLALRIGVHTGLVVIGEMGGAGRQEQLVLGEVPNVCSRIQGLAASNTLVVSEATYRLIQGYFECQDLGAQVLRGVTESMRLYHVLSESGATSRLEVAQPRGLTPLVGRESEVGLLVERWEQAKAGHGQVVLLTGDAGIGKSRLVQMLKEHVAHEPHMRWECRSLQYYQNTALYPLTDLFQRTIDGHRMPGDKRGSIGAEPDHGFGTFFRLAHSSHRMTGDDLFFHLGSAQQRLLDQGGPNIAWTHRVDTDTRFGILQRRGFRQAHHPVLARIICRGPTPGTDQTHNRGGVDNRATALVQHLENFVLHTEPHALQINGEDLVPDVFRAFV